MTAQKTIQDIYAKGDYTTQDFTVSIEDKYKYGEIYTPYSLIEKMFNLFHPDVFTQKDKKWLDTGAGTGYFSIYLYKSLMDGLKKSFPNKEKRHNHIIQNMLYMVELKEINIIKLRDCFGKDANIISIDYLQYDPLPIVFEPTTFAPATTFDYIIGNPPYNSDGIKKVPTNQAADKKTDGKTIWVSFIKHSISLLKPNTGKLLYIVPSIWMKPDKAKIYNLITSYKIEKLVSLNNTETNGVFNGNAQTPTCYFLLSKEPTDGIVPLYDKSKKNFIPYRLKKGSTNPLPVFGANLSNKLAPFIEKYGCLKPNKTNMPKTGSLFSLDENAYENKYPNIKTCIIENGVNPKLLIEYSNIEQSYAGIPKLVLAHKMYGFPYLDISGTYGISNRDNYVFHSMSVERMKKIGQFLSTKTALYLFEMTRYRMKYLEKYAFELIPDITNIADFPEVINDETIADYFGFDKEERIAINALHKKEYNSLIK